MWTKSKKTIVTVTLIVLAAEVFNAVVWWANGFDQTWLFVIAGLAGLWGFIPLFTMKNKDKSTPPS